MRNVRVNKFKITTGRLEEFLFWVVKNPQDEWFIGKYSNYSFGNILITHFKRVIKFNCFTYVIIVKSARTMFLTWCNKLLYRLPFWPRQFFKFIFCKFILFYMLKYNVIRNSNFISLCHKILQEPQNKYRNSVIPVASILLCLL